MIKLEHMIKMPTNQYFFYCEMWLPIIEHKNDVVKWKA
jgi:hypothetical protein